MTTPDAGTPTPELGTVSLDFQEWWESQDTVGLNSACKFAAWNAWLHQERELTAAQAEIAALREELVRAKRGEPISDRLNAAIDAARKAK